MAIKTKKISEWIAQNGAAITSASKASMLAYLNQNMRPLQDGVYIGKAQKETWGTYMRVEPWQTTNIGISAADADAIVIQHGGYRLGIALTEPSAGTMLWGSVAATGYQNTSDNNTFDGKTRTAGIMASASFKSDDAATYAVSYCYNYSKSHTGDPGGTSTIAAKAWWLPTMGDLSLIHQHFETINLALQRIKDAGKQSADLLQRTYYWSCCEGSASTAWLLNFSNGSRGNGNKTTFKIRVRPVTAF